MHKDLRTHLVLLAISLFAVAAGLSTASAMAEDASALIGNWRVPGYEQERYRMSPQCQRHAEADVSQIGESEVEVFDCNDPKYAPVKQRILAYVRSVNPIYRAEGHPLYSETISGLCAVVRQSTSSRKQDMCNPSRELRAEPIVGLPVIWNIRPTGRSEWPYRGDSYSPSSGFGAISCFKQPSGGRLLTKGCRRWTVEVPILGSEPCDCGCSMIVCDKYVWGRK